MCCVYIRRSDEPRPLFFWLGSDTGTIYCVVLSDSGRLSQTQETQRGRAVSFHSLPSVSLLATATPGPCSPVSPFAMLATPPQHGIKEHACHIPATTHTSGSCWGPCSIMFRHVLSSTLAGSLVEPAVEQASPTDSPVYSKTRVPSGGYH